VIILGFVEAIYSWYMINGYDKIVPTNIAQYNASQNNIEANKLSVYNSRSTSSKKNNIAKPFSPKQVGVGWR
jgi:hypothetical protein